MHLQHSPRFWAVQLVRRALGEKGLQHLTMTRRKFYWQQAGVAFIHVPKAAGSSVSHALYGRRLGHVRYRDIQRFKPEVVDQLPVFSVVRDPASRLVSAYRYVRSAGTAEGGVLDRPVYHESVFEAFEPFLFDWLPTIDVAEQDYVFQPQASFLKDKNGDIPPSIRLFTLELGMPDLADYLAPFTNQPLIAKNANKQTDDVAAMLDCLKSHEGRAVLERCYGEDMALYRSVRDGVSG